jgi:glyoxylase-like metal-dependent hydrolase (beta-lactamase superfamily II)/rhodanese-related sulfurtransferase
MIAGSGSAAVVDPSRDTGGYLKAAEELGVRITHVLETHLHADFVSGHTDLAASGALIVAPASAECAFPHRGVREGDSFSIENIRFAVMETPGHTPEHVSYAVADTSRGPEPAGVFCGDTLFVGDAGRPDLFPGRARELASSLYDSLRRLTELPDFCEVWPAHGAGSLCGRSLASKYTSTVGYERLHNPVLRRADREDFIRHLTTDMPPAPDHFSRCSAINARGPALLSELPDPAPLPPGEFMSAVEAGAFVLDVRRYDAFSGMHVPGSASIDAAGNLPTFAGWTAPPDRRILLVADGPGEASDAALWLRRVGLDDVAGYLEGGMASWASAGYPFGRLPQVSARRAEALIRSDPGSVVVLDVRAPAEFRGSHPDRAVNIPAPDLRHRHGELDREKEILVVCGTGQRSTLGASILMAAGFRRVSSLGGGLRGMQAASLAPACSLCAGPHGPGIQE